MDLTKLEQTTENAPPRLVIYGPEGTGKSTFAADAPNTVFMDIENGLGGIRSAKQKIDTWADVMGMLKALKEQPHTFQTLAVDSLDWMERLIFDIVCRAEKVGNIADIGYGRGPIFALQYWDIFLEKLEELHRERGMIIILISHSQIKTFNDPMGQAYDRYLLKFHDKAAALVQEWADGVLFLKPKTAFTVKKGAFGAETKEGQNVGVYMHTTSSPAFAAKNRKSLSLPPEFQISKEDPWKDFVAQLHKG